MATITPVGIGAAPDDGNGDPLRTAFSKINTNEDNLNADKLEAPVALASLADMATDSFLGRDTAGSGSPEVLSASTARTVMDVPQTTLTLTAGDGLTGGGNLSTNRTFDVDISGSTDDAVPARTDEILIDDGAIKKSDIGAVVDLAKPLESFIIAASDKTTSITTGTNKSIPIRMPYAFVVSEVRANVDTAPTGAVITIDINEDGTTILSTKLTIDATETTSTTAATAAVISDANLADDAEITIDFDGVGSTEGGVGVVVSIIGRQA